MEVAEVTIQENDDPRGILQFNVSEVSSGSSLWHLESFIRNNFSTDTIVTHLKG